MYIQSTKTGWYKNLEKRLLKHYILTNRYRRQNIVSFTKAVFLRCQNFFRKGLFLEFVYRSLRILYSERGLAVVSTNIAISKTMSIL